VINTVRRYYLAKRFAAVERDDLAIASVWRAKQEAEPGTALASDFPARTKLIAAGYSAVEDLQGSDTNELRRRASLSRREADAVIAALEI
jgi:hypothetical protein